MSASLWRGVVLQGGGEQVNPEIIGVGNGFLSLLAGFGLGFFARQAVGIEAGIILNRRQRHIVHVKGRIRHHKIELTHVFKRLFTVAIGLPHIPAKTIHRQVHFCQLYSVEGFLLAVNVQLVFVMRLAQLVQFSSVGFHKLL